MKKKRFSVEQIVGVLKQAEVGVPVAELIRKVGISEQTFYRWKKQYVGLEVDQVRQMKQLQEENTAPEAVGGGVELDKTMLQEVLAKKVVRPARRRPLVDHLRNLYRTSERRACRVLRIGRGTYRYQSHQEPWTELRTADSGDRTEPGAIRIPQDPSAVEA